MPPKKKKSTPIVVGTVSTRSTRRQSIVNIEIIPKANKPANKTPVPKKTTKKPSKSPKEKDLDQESLLGSSQKTRPEILEILRDWSDDDNSQDDSVLSILDKTCPNVSSLHDDQQSLIDILEGNQLEPNQLNSVKKPLEHKHKQKASPKPVKSALAKDLLENPVVNIDSPKIEESEIIEECVVEDDSIIIELPDEQMEEVTQENTDEGLKEELSLREEDISIVDNKLGSPVHTLRSKTVVQKHMDYDSDHTEQKSQHRMNQEDKKNKNQKDNSNMLPKMKHSDDTIGEKLKPSSSYGTDEESRSITSEDTTSQSMITVQDEDALDANEIHISDNSTNNYEIIEEQVVFDTSESIIIENLDNDSEVQMQKSDLCETNKFNLGLKKDQKIENLAKNEQILSSNNQSESIKSLKDNTDLSISFPEKSTNSMLEEAVELPNKREIAIKQQKEVKCNDSLLRESFKDQDKGSCKTLLTNKQKDNKEKISLQSSKSLQEDLEASDNFNERNSDESVSTSVTEPTDNKVIPHEEKKDPGAVSKPLLKYIENIQNSVQIQKSCDSFQSSIQKSNLERYGQRASQDQSINPVEQSFSEENVLCQKINQSMQISKESSEIKDFDPASEKLQEGIKKIHIDEKYESDNTTEATKSTSKNDNVNKAAGMEIQTKEISSLAQDTEINKLDGPGLSSVVEKGKKETLTSGPQTKRGKQFILDLEKSPKGGQVRNANTEDVTQRRRSTRRKATIEEAMSLETPKKEEISTNIKSMSNKATPVSQSNSSFEYSFQEEQISKQLRVKDKKVQKKEDEKQNSENDSKIVCDGDLDPNKDVKTPKDSKGKYKRALEKQAGDIKKMDIDCDISEAKTPDAKGDSNVNESIQESNSAKAHKTRAKSAMKKHIEESNKIEEDSELDIDQTFSGMETSELDLETTTDENSQNKKAKGTKTKAKKATEEEISKMDISENLSDIEILRANIDATIDDVLRKFTEDESGTIEDTKEIKSTMAKPVKEFKKKKYSKHRKDEKIESSEEVRRSDRIKTILPVKKKSHGLVRSKSESSLSVEAENSDSNSVPSEVDKPTPVSPQINKKSKSKTKSYENLQVLNSGSLLSENSPQLPKTDRIDLKADKTGQAEIEARLKSFVHLRENQYKTDRQVCKEAQEMICDCYLAEEDIQKDEYGCGEDCLNRLLMIECGHLCQIGDRCTNKRFQKVQVAPVEVFKTEKKGLGLIAAANIPYGEFILEYIGEVLDPDEFDKRAEVYSKDKNIHFYFMSLRSDAIIDATMKGNISRFINHSCDPNAETQKWTVNGELRIGFFSTRTILAGEEITFDYKFQRYGKEAQKCYCGAATCRGWLGERPDESEDEDEEEEEEALKEERPETIKAEVKVPSSEILGAQELKKESDQEKISEKLDVEAKAEVAVAVKTPEDTLAPPKIEETPKKVNKKKPRKELLYEDFDQLNEDIEMLVTTGLKNQAHTLKLSRLMVRAKDLEQRKKILRVLRRGELPCRRLFLDYHGLRLMHGYMIDAQQLATGDKKTNSSLLELLQTKLELLQTLAVLPIQNKTMLIESKVLPAVEKWAKNEDLVEDSNDHKESKKSSKEISKQEENLDPAAKEKIDEIKFLASKLLEEWVNLKQSFRIPKKQRIEQMKEHEKEANRKFLENSHAQEKESSRKNDQRYRSWSRYKSERETNKKGHRVEDKEKPSAEYLKMSKLERRKLFALQMELKEEERRLKQREMWRQHEMNCMMIGADPRFTAPFDPNKGFQYIWNPSIGQWQALPVPSTQSQSVYNSPATPQGVSGYNVPPTSQAVPNYNVPPTHKPSLLGPYPPSMLNVPGMSGPSSQYPGMQPNMAPMVPGLNTPVSAITSTVPVITPPLPGIPPSLSGLPASLSGLTASLPGISGVVPGITSSIHGMTGSSHGITGGTSHVITGSVPGITQPPLPALPMYQEVKQPEEDPSKVKFAGPIPPPVKLPPKWKCAKDKYGRPYYYHIKIRKSQWEPPPLPEEAEESSETSSTDSSSVSSSESSSDSDTEDEIDDAKLLTEVRRQMDTTSKIPLKSVIPHHVRRDGKDSATPSPEVKIESENEDEPTERLKEEIEEENPEKLSSIDIRLKEQFNLDSSDPPKKKRRIGLCQEIIISPRTEEDRQHFKEDLKRYKATKEKLKRQKEQMLHQAKKKLKTGSSTDIVRKSRDKRPPKATSKSRIKQMGEWNDEHAKKIKEVFRSTMATTVVGVLNAYRKPDCKESRITNTDDFKHLARKLTHFVMLKEIKHINTIDELICTDNVKAKAREYIKKYMSKFGEVYQKRHDEPDFKD